MNLRSEEITTARVCDGPGGDFNRPDATQQQMWPSGLGLIAHEPLEFAQSLTRARLGKRHGVFTATGMSHSQTVLKIIRAWRAFGQFRGQFKKPRSLQQLIDVARGGVRKSCCVQDFRRRADSRHSAAACERELCGFRFGHQSTPTSCQEDLTAFSSALVLP